MHTKDVTIMINSTFYDMIGEYYYFIKEIYPELVKICQKHNINIKYQDVAYSVKKKSRNNEIILEDLRHIDADRTFFICFRGQQLGWKPNPNDINRLTLGEYPELVDYIGRVSITELVIMHALKPFDKRINDEIKSLPPVRHSLFYLRNGGYGKYLSDAQKLYYGNDSINNDKEVKDMEIAKAKDLIYEIKNEFDENDDKSRINIRRYDGIWDDNLNLEELFIKYTQEYSKLIDTPLDDYIKVHKNYLCEDTQGCFGNFECENKSLKEILIEDIINELKLEFPENFGNI